MSSANILPYNSRMKAKSLLKSKKNTGPSTLPCGTPQLIDIKLDFLLLNFIITEIVTHFQMGAHS